jgi:cytochrome P450
LDRGFVGLLKPIRIVNFILNPSDSTPIDLAWSESAKPFSYVPFGGGLRDCLGKEFARLEMKLFAAKIVREFEWELLPDQDLNLIAIPAQRPATVCE